MTRHFAEREASDLERMLEENAAYNNARVVKVPMVIPKGHMSFHHCRTYHGSGANRSSRPRRAISFHLQDGENAYRPFVLSTGETLAYNHDVLVRHLTDGRPDYADPDFCPVLWSNPERPADGQPRIPSVPCRRSDMSRYDWGQRHYGIDRLEEQISEARDAVITHPLYARAGQPPRDPDVH